MMWEDEIEQFLWPKKKGYTVQNTIIYSILLIVAAYIIFKILKKLHVKIDRRLSLAISPYVIWGAALRSLEDANFLESFWLVTPGIYLFVFLVVFSTLLIALILDRKFKIPYYKVVFIAGILLNSFTLINIKPVNFYGMELVLAFFILWPIIFYLYKKWNLENRIVTTIQMFDATVTFVSLNFFGYTEQHIFPTFIINIFGPFSFVILKLIGIVAILILIDKYSDDKEFNTYLKLVIGILGGATGIRDFLSLLALV